MLHEDCSSVNARTSMHRIGQPWHVTPALHGTWMHIHHMYMLSVFGVHLLPFGFAPQGETVQGPTQEV